MMLPWMEELETLIWLGSLRSTKKRTEVTVHYVSILEEPWSPRRSCGEKRVGIWGIWHIFVLLSVEFLGRFMHNFIEGIIGITILLVFQQLGATCYLANHPVKKSAMQSLCSSPRI